MGFQTGATVDEGLVILAVIVAILVNLFFLFRVLPWARPGPWRIIWALAAMFALMFILAEGSILTESAMSAADIRHQAPLFAALLTGAAGFFIAYTQGYGLAERQRTLSLIDPLTQLANLRAIEGRLRVAHANGDRFTLVYADLDGFKDVNDRFGHARGDEVLRGVADVMRQSVRGADIAARVGGDEFVLLLEKTDPAQAPIVVRRVLAGLRALDTGDGKGLGGSFGIATTGDGAAPLEIVAAADAAMFRAKKAGGDRIAFAKIDEGIISLRPDGAPS